MNQTSTASLPTAIGMAILSLAGRGIAWSAGKIMHAPMTATGVALVAGLSLMAMANALFMQEGYHPAPLFGAPAARAPAPVDPVIERPAELVAPPRPAAERAPAPEPEPAPEPVADEPQTQQAPAIGNADIAELQKKLKDMGIFEGMVDGYYGPKTADAIRAFESRTGLPRTGAATPEVIEAVRNASLAQPEASAQPQPEAQAQSAPEPQAMPAPVTAQPAAQDIAALIAGDQARADSVSSGAADTQVVDAQARAPDTAIAAAPADAQIPAARDRDLVRAVQRGLAQLGFLQAPADGVVSESTAEAIRKFEIFHNYPTTGQVTYDLVDMLAAAGADV